MKIYTVILAAGEGKRMRSRKPKVLHKIGQVPMINNTLLLARELNSEKSFSQILPIKPSAEIRFFLLGNVKYLLLFKASIILINFNLFFEFNHFLSSFLLKKFISSLLN